jgi:hypothetical protein
MKFLLAIIALFAVLTTPALARGPCLHYLDVVTLDWPIVSYNILVSRNGGVIGANMAAFPQWKDFLIVNPANPNAAGDLHVGDQIAIRTFQNNYLTVPSSNVANGGATTIGPHETFTIGMTSTPSCISSPSSSTAPMVWLKAYNGRYLVIDGPHDKLNALPGFGNIIVTVQPWTDFYYKTAVVLPGTPCAPCPDGGRWDGAHCFVLKPARPARLYGNQLAYQTSVCDYLPGTMHGIFANQVCSIGGSPSGSQAFVWNNAQYWNGKCTP